MCVSESGAQRRNISAVCVCVCVFFFYLLRQLVVRLLFAVVLNLAGHVRTSVRKLLFDRTAAPHLQRLGTKTTTCHIFLRGKFVSFFLARELLSLSFLSFPSPPHFSLNPGSGSGTRGKFVRCEIRKLRSRPRS